MSTSAVKPTPCPATNGTEEESELAELAARLEGLHPREILAYALEKYSPAAAIALSGAGSAVLVDMAARIGKSVRVFSLDTGRLHPETYQFFERIRERYGICLEIFFPQQRVVERLVRDKGLFSFYRDGHQECCSIRKVEPLERALSDLSAWITGQRRDQSPSTRSGVPVVQLDRRHASPERQLVKFNPLAHWSLAELWGYIRQHSVPVHPLHEQGYVSIGCQPCTRPILPGQHEREGRWWWEDQTKKECGIHESNPSRQGEGSPLGK
jgi:phosphoadenosine phosphosulfate reductase